MAAKKTNKQKEIVEDKELHIEDDKSYILIRYANFENKLWPRLILALIRHVGENSILNSKYNDEKTMRKGIINNNDNRNFSTLIRDVKFTFFFRRILRIFKAHHIHYNNTKNELLKKFGKIDPISKQPVLIEENAVNFKNELSKFQSTIVKLDIQKFDPRYIFDDLQVLYQYYLEVTELEKGDMTDQNTVRFAMAKNKPLLYEGYQVDLFFEVIEDLFDVDKMFDWKENSEVKLIHDQSFGISN